MATNNPDPLVSQHLKDEMAQAAAAAGVSKPRRRAAAADQGDTSSTSNSSESAGGGSTGVGQDNPADTSSTPHVDEADIHRLTDDGNPHHDDETGEAGHGEDQDNDGSEEEEPEEISDDWIVDPEGRGYPRGALRELLAILGEDPEGLSSAEMILKIDCIKSGYVAECNRAKGEFDKAAREHEEDSHESERFPVWLTPASADTVRRAIDEWRYTIAASHIDNDHCVNVMSQIDAYIKRWATKLK